MRSFLSSAADSGDGGDVSTDDLSAVCQSYNPVSRAPFDHPAPRASDLEYQCMVTGRGWSRTSLHQRPGGSYSSQSPRRSCATQGQLWAPRAVNGRSPIARGLPSDIKAAGPDLVFDAAHESRRHSNSLRHAPSLAAAKLRLVQPSRQWHGQCRLELHYALRTRAALSPAIVR